MRSGVSSCPGGAGCPPVITGKPVSLSLVMTAASTVAFASAAASPLRSKSAVASLSFLPLLCSAEWLYLLDQRIREIEGCLHSSILLVNQLSVKVRLAIRAAVCRVSPCLSFSPAA